MKYALRNVALSAGLLMLNILIGYSAEAQTGTLFVEGDAVGIGTDTPGSTNGFGGVQAKLHLKTTTSNDGGLLVENASSTKKQRVLFQLKNLGNIDFSLLNTSGDQDWRFQNFEGSFRITKAGTGVGEVTVTETGNVIIAGEVFTSGSCSSGCDRVFEDSYEMESIEDHAAYMWAEKHLPAVGPTPEHGRINLSKKTLGMLNELEKAHIYIEQLARRLHAEEELVAELRRENGALQDRLERVEEVLGLGTDE